MENRKENMHLLYGPNTALVTPFAEDGRTVNYDAISPLIKYQLDSGIAGFLVGGNSGEYKKLRMADRKKLLEYVLYEVGGQVPVVAHVGTDHLDQDLQLRQAQMLARHAQRVGADAIATVFFDPRGDYTKHLSRLASVTDQRLYIYIRDDSPLSVTPERFMEDMRPIEDQLAGIKFTDNRTHWLAEVKRLSGGKLNTLTGHDMNFLAGLMVYFTEGGIGTNFNVLAKAIAKVYKAYQEGNTELAVSTNADIMQYIYKARDFDVTKAAKGILEVRGIPVGPIYGGDRLRPEQAAELNTLGQRLALFD